MLQAYLPDLNSPLLKVRYDLRVKASIAYQLQVCNSVQREGIKIRPGLASRLFCYEPLYNMWSSSKTPLDAYPQFVIDYPQVVKQ